MEETQINFTPELFSKLKQEYKKAIDNGLESFEFEGHTLVVSYAKYLIEYLDSQVKG